MELTGSRQSSPSHQNGEESFLSMGLGKVVILLGSFGNISKGCPPERELNSAPCTSVSPETVTCHTFVQADVPNAQSLPTKQAHRFPGLTAQTPGDTASRTPQSLITLSGTCPTSYNWTTSRRELSHSSPPLLYSWESAVSNFWEEDTAFFRETDAAITDIHRF